MVNADPHDTAVAGDPRSLPLFREVERFGRLFSAAVQCAELRAFFERNRAELDRLADLVRATAEPLPVRLTFIVAAPLRTIHHRPQLRRSQWQ